MLTPEQLSVLYLPFLICVILTGIHGYLGIHVLGRKVIFVDIALAQIAALGSTVAFLMGYDPHTETAYFFSLTFAVLAAVVFAGSRQRHERVPQEAIIGLTYAIAQAAAILLADIAPHGAEHLKELMDGSIVWVTAYQVKKTFLMYSALGLFHYIFYKQFLLISLDPEAAFEKGMRVRLWDLLFYTSFGIVITSSVQIAGVLLVFCYLVAPAVFAVMFAESLGARLAISWTLGVVVSALGLLFSYDRPSGPTIMVFFALALIIAGIYKKLRDYHHPLIALFLAFGVVIGVGFAGVRAFQRFSVPEHAHEEAEVPNPVAPAPRLREEHAFGTTLSDLLLSLQDEHPNVRAKAAEMLGQPGTTQPLPALIRALSDKSPAVREKVAGALARIGDPSSIPELRRAVQVKGEDSWVHFRLVQALAMSGDAQALGMLIDVVAGQEPKLLRNDALALLLKLEGTPPKTSLDVDSTEGKAALETAKGFWRDKGAGLRWNKASKTYG